MNRLRTAALLTGLCLVLSAISMLSGCGLAKDLNIINPSYSIRDIRPRVQVALPLSASSIDFDFTVGIDNPNRVGLRLDKIDFSLFVNDTRVVDSVSDQGINIPANKYGEVRLRSRVGYQNLRSMFQEVAGLIQGNRARYELRGNAYYNTPVGQLKFPVTVYSSGDNSR